MNEPQKNKIDEKFWLCKNIDFCFQACRKSIVA